MENVEQGEGLAFAPETQANSKGTAPPQAESAQPVEAPSPQNRSAFTNNTPRFAERQITLNDCFAESKMIKYWHDYVKPGMRSQAYPDMHDNYDFHRNIKQRVASIRSQILSGSYRPAAPSFVRLEKSKGITRRLAIPDADDALVLQAIVEAIAPLVRAKQPSENSFYSRSHSSKSKRVGVFGGEDYIWFKQYKKFFGKLVEMADRSEYIIIADLANYFDTIEFAKLRNVIASLGNIDEAILDFLFYMLEGFSWRSDYMPHSGRGLPQIDFDAPRLLGHAFLFEIDGFLVKRGVPFVRWMDDVDISIKSIGSARRVLQGINDLLMTRGLSLNSAKTVILDQKKASEFLWSTENSKLDVLEQEITGIDGLSASHKNRLRKRLESGLRSVMKKKPSGRWEKVVKRYIALCGKAAVVVDAASLLTLLNEAPGCRDTVFRYIEVIGSTKDYFDLLNKYVFGDYCVDDVSEFHACLVMVKWEVGAESEMQKALVGFAERIGSDGQRNILSAIWLMGKYAGRRELGRFLMNTRNRWANDKFLARQVAALFPRIWDLKAVSAPIYHEFIARGMTQAVYVVNNLMALRKVTDISRAEFLYICGDESLKSGYRLQKALIALAFLQSETLNSADFQKMKEKLLGGVKDPIFQQWFSSAD